MAKATAIAHPIQGLVKYHGLRDWERVIPFHDSISVCMGKLRTTTTVEPEHELGDDVVTINGIEATGEPKHRVKRVLNAIRTLANSQEHARVVSINSLSSGKGLGFSSSAFASLGLAASVAYGLKIATKNLTELVRLGSGSATRSLVGGFAIWYSNKGGRSYAEQLAGPDELPFASIIVPLPSPTRTWDAHREAVTSPLFKFRLEYVGKAIGALREAIAEKDVEQVCRIAEEDSLFLHAVTMTGRNSLVLWSPETLRLAGEVVKARGRGAPIWFSVDTGPSLFVSTHEQFAKEALELVQGLGASNALLSQVGGGAELVHEHLF